ncbi:MAG: 2-C-methyl-D-erythritol 4-phosphate cytidylyltransferase [Candidatus Omnitrophica bacterium]|nr:2-C-methyl-D-erythritol 4-phosphate cytidylyltransferase [Candidatus Omnitrophota bacterium]
MNDRVAAVIVAGGVGRRLKRKLHKPFVPLAGKPMLAWTLAAVEKTPSVKWIVAVVHPGDRAAAKRLIRRYGCRKVIGVVAGGQSRMESVFNGLKALPEEARWVAVHDGARPLVTPAVFQSAVKAARRSKAAIVAVPVVPTIKSAEGGWVQGTLDRSRLWAVQTPQVFERRLLDRAHETGRRLGIQATDDAALVEALGHKVRIVEGAASNLKVTTPEDLILAEAFLRRRGKKSS